MKKKKFSKKFRTSIETLFVMVGLLLVFIKLFDRFKAFSNWNKK